MKTILYVEEVENALAKAIVLRKDINLLLVRFSNCQFFSEEHKRITKCIPTFVIDKSVDFSQECIRLKEFIDKWCKKIDFFYNDSEFNQIYIQKVARALNLPGALTEYQASVVRDKYLMKCFIESIGMKCAQYCMLSSIEDVYSCIDRWKFPFIIKWRTGLSSIEVYKINSKEDFEHLNLNFDSPKYLAEQYQPEKIWCIDAITKDGKVLSNLYTWLPYTNLSFAENKTRFVQLATGDPQQKWEFNPKKLTQKIIDNLKLDSGYLHLEVFVTNTGEPVICEFAWRTPGDHMLQNFSILYGLSIENMLIDILLGKDVNSLKTVSGCVADVFLPMVNGKISRISSIEDMEHKCDIINGEILYKKGDVLSSRHRYTDSSGWVQVKADNVDHIMKKIASTKYVQKLSRNTSIPRSNKYESDNPFS